MPESTSLDDAVAILGADKVLSTEQMAQVFSIEDYASAWIRYPVATLERAANENVKQKADWRLIRAFGLSFLEQRDKVKYGSNGFSLFQKEYSWWDPKELKFSPWIGKKSSSGYYLINFGVEEERLTWKEWQKKTEKSGTHLKIANERAVSQAVLGFVRIHNERLLERVGHIGSGERSGNFRIQTGFFEEEDGLTLETVPLHHSRIGCVALTEWVR